MRECKVCGKAFTPTRPMQSVCGYVCAGKLPKLMRKTEKDKDKARKEKLKSRAQWMKEAQAAFNAFIRRRDDGQPCICCRRMHGGQHHAGHFRSVGSAPELRFDERNVWRTCAPCNTHLSGNLLEYRKTLVLMFGNEWVEALEGPHPPKKWTIEELKAIKEKYR